MGCGLSSNTDRQLYYNVKKKHKTGLENKPDKYLSRCMVISSDMRTTVSYFTDLQNVNSGQGVVG
jgi:hypothetical protein